MKLRAFNLLLSLAIVLGLAACGEKPVPTETVSAADHKQTAPPSDGTVAERISRLMEFYEESGQFGGAVLVAQDGNIIINDLEYDPPTISAASVVGLAVLESGGDAAV